MALAVLEEELFELPAVEEDPLAGRAPLDRDPFDRLGLQVVPALRALAPVFDPKFLRLGALPGAVGLGAALPGGLDQLAFVLREQPSSRARRRSSLSIAGF